MLGVKGVISFTFNMAARRCYLRVHSDLKPEVLCRAVSEVPNLEARQLVKNENGEEVSLWGIIIATPANQCTCGCKVVLITATWLANILFVSYVVCLLVCVSKRALCLCVRFCCRLAPVPKHRYRMKRRTSPSR